MGLELGHFDTHQVFDGRPLRGHAVAMPLDFAPRVRGALQEPHRCQRMCRPRAPLLGAHSPLPHSLSPSLSPLLALPSPASRAARHGRRDRAQQPPPLAYPSSLSVSPSCHSAFAIVRRSSSPGAASRCRPRAATGALCRRSRPLAWPDRLGRSWAELEVPAAARRPLDGCTTLPRPPRRPHRRNRRLPRRPLL
jgi:hypothetical protein